MIKAEQRALAYAKTHSHLGYDYDQTFDAVKYGYLQAEKDLALTPDDIKLITKIHYEIVFKDTTGIKIGDISSEVLRRFNEQREKK